MNNRQQKYEPLAQRDDPIILSPLPNQNQIYNYNSATPDSVSAPSILSRTSTSTPPPSFHTHSSPGTPRPQQQQYSSINPNFIPVSNFEPSILNGNISNNLNGSGNGNGRQWGAPPSSDTEVGGGIGSSNDALATIKGLKQRVDWLEESLGRLLLEKERDPSNSSGSQPERNNCCVSFSDISPDLERAVLANKQNCFVAYNGTKNNPKPLTPRLLLVAFLVFVVLICGTVTIIMVAGRR